MQKSSCECTQEFGEYERRKRISQIVAKSNSSSPCVSMPSKRCTPSLERAISPKYSTLQFFLKLSLWSDIHTFVDDVKNGVTDWIRFSDKAYQKIHWVWKMSLQL